MARLIVKSPYIDCGKVNAKPIGGYMKYIATRERVEKIADDRPPTKEQEKLIGSLLRDFPKSKNSEQYKNHTAAPTRTTASDFITATLEEHFEAAQQSEKYMRYIATRPGAQKVGSHGLFGDEDNINLEQKMSELETYKGRVWTHIISLKREDATRLGYDNAETWRNLLRSHRNEIAAAMNIPADNFRWYAAFHDEGDHPHVHMMAWSRVEGEGYLGKEGIRSMKSKLTNDIFRQDLLHVYEQKSQSRDELVSETRRAMRELVKQMSQSICDHPKAEELMSQLAERLENVQGKKSYGYLPKADKRLVDEIVDEMERLPTVKKCYAHWWSLQHQVESYYHDRPEEYVPLSKQKEFRAIKNAVIHEAERLRLGEVTFEDANLRGNDEPLAEENVSWAYWDLKEVIEDAELDLSERDAAIDDLTKLAEDGDPDAQYYLGRLWRDGPLLTPDWVNARYWFDQAAQQNHPQAQYALGKLYLSDDIEMRDIRKGIAWLQTAAKNGNEFAAYRLGKEYLKGNVVAKDAAKAAELFTQAAEAGLSQAQYMLGKMYLGDMGIRSDLSLAEYWLTQAANQGHAYAEYLLNRQNERPPSVMLSVSRLLHHISRIFDDNVPPPEKPPGMQIDRKRLQKLREKHQALGRKDIGLSDQGMKMSY